MDDELMKQEEKNIRRLRFLVNLTESVLMQSDMNLQESLNVVENTKKAVLSLFPDKEFAFELIYRPRFRRIIDERFTIPGTSSGRN